MTGVVDVTADSGSDVAEVVDISDAESGGDAGCVSEVAAAPGVPPVRFRGYRRGQELGRGSSGKVFLCNRKSSPTGFAVKIIDLRRIEMSPYAEREQKKLRREIDILKKLPPHKSVVQLVDAFEEGHWMFFVLELVGGGDLFTVLTSRASPRLFDREAAFVLQQLVCGLEFLHGQGVIHRDLKLENILVASERRQRPLVLYTIKITDFGLSKSVGQGLSEARSTVGTKPYTAPEVLREGVHDFSSDLWCLGVLLFVLLAGHFPFDHIAARQVDLDKIVGRVQASEEAKSVLQGFLRLEPASRTKLADVRQQAWLQDELVSGRPERPAKRLRTSSVSSTASSSAAAAAAARAPTPASASAATAPVVPAAAANAPATAAAPGAGGCGRRRTVGGEAALPASSASAGASGHGATATPEDALRARAPGGSGSGEGPQDAAGAAAEAVAEAALGAERGVGGGVAGDEAAASAAAAAVTTELAQQAESAHGEADVGGLRIPKGAWTPFAVEATVRLAEVHPPSPQPDVMQVHVVILERLAGAVLGKCGARIQQTAVAAGCPVWMTTRDGSTERRVVIVGNYKQCKIAQEIVHEQISSAQDADWRDTEAEVYLLVRAEAAGVVTGKQGFVLDRIRKHSGARIELLRQEVEGQRPCVVAGTLCSVLRAQRLVFHLVSCVPVRQSSDQPRAASAAGAAAAAGTVAPPDGEQPLGSAPAAAEAA